MGKHIHVLIGMAIAASIEVPLAHSAEVKVLSDGPLAPALRHIGESFRGENGNTVKFEFGGSLISWELKNRRPKMGLFGWLFGSRDPYHQDIERNRKRAAANMGFTWVPPLGDGGANAGSCDAGSSAVSCDAAGGGGDGGGGGGGC